MPPEKHPFSPLVIYILYFAVILSWGFSWPLTKIGITHLSPTWFVAWRLILAAVCLFAYLIFQGTLTLPKKKDLPIIISIGVIQEACYFLFSATGLEFENTGRASLLVYSTPLWVTPISILFFKERMNAMKICGLVLGILGFLFLFNPLSFDWGNRKLLICNAFLILASISWAIGILHTRYGRWHSSMPVLVAWQTGLAASLFIIFALITQPLPKQSDLYASAWPLIYTGVISSGFGAVVGFIVTRHLPVVTTSISLLAVPIVGIISSSLWLKEQLSMTTIVAATLIMAGLGCMIFKPPSEKGKPKGKVEKGD